MEDTEKENKSGEVYITENDNFFVADKNLAPEDFTRFAIETDINAFKEKIAKLEAELLALNKGEHFEEIERNTHLTQENEEENTATPPDNYTQPAEISNSQNVLPSFAVITKNGIKHYENMKVSFLDNENNQYYLDNGKEKIILPASTYQTILHPETLETKKLDFREAETIEESPAFVEGKTKIPEFALITNHGLQTYKDFVVQKFNQNENSYTLSDGNKSITVSSDTFKEITQPDRFEKQFDEKSPAYEKLIQSQYEDFFKPRDNTANNFIHNLKVYCRQECNTPLDAVNVSKELISRMDKEEQKKTRVLLQALCREDEKITNVIIRNYYDAIKEFPLNENYIKENFPDKKIARPFYDTISENGQLIDKDFNLKVGDTIKDIAFNTKDLFGNGTTKIHEDLQIVSASKEGNSVVLMDKNKSYYNVPRDTLLEGYKQQQNNQHKQHNKNEISISY